MNNGILRLVHSACILFMILAAFGQLNAEEKSPITIGWAVADITPSKPVPLIGQFHKRISEYVRDPLTATVLALESKNELGHPEQAILISCDQVSIPGGVQNDVRNLVKEKIPDFDCTRLFLNATHTHTAPGPRKIMQYDTSEDTGIMTEMEFGEFMIERIAEAAVQAWKGRTPGGVSWGLGHAVVGHNRRIVYSDGSAEMYGNTNTERFRTVEGPSDHGIEMLFTWDSNSRLTGMVLNVSCPSQVVESAKFVSADYWSEVRKELRKRYSNDIFVLPQCGAAGDQSPRDLPRRRRGEPDMWSEAGLMEIGRRIADAVDDVFPAARDDIKTELPFMHRVKNITLPVRRVTLEEYQEAFTVYSTYKKLQEASGAGIPADYSDELTRTMGFTKAIVDRYSEQRNNPYLNFELHAVRIGEVAFANNPFELYLEYGMQIETRSMAEQTHIIQLSGDAAGYLPTERAIRGGGYSTHIFSTRVGPDGGTVLVEETVNLINSMWD